jgi:hypothetical protein
MQLDISSPPAGMFQFQPILKLVDFPSLPPAASAPCATTGKFLTLFEEITGWKAEFTESKQSLRRREISSSKTEPIEGRFAITDMSLDWPAKKPTCHRAKCDELVSLVEQLVGELQTTQMDLKRAQSALVAFDPAAEINDENLIDSFVPKFLSESNRNESVGDSASDLSDRSADGDFEVEQFVGDSAVSLVAPPFAGWSFGGATGIVGNYYLDWTVDEEERISLVAGEIDSETDADREATLTIDPLTQEYRLGSPGVQTPNGNDFTVFYLWNERTESLHPIESGETWSNLLPNEAIVATTNGAMRELDTLKYSHCRQLAEAGVEKAGFRESENSDCNLAALGRSQFSKPHAESIKAAELATFFRQTTGSSQPLLILKRD